MQKFVKLREWKVGKLHILKQEMKKRLKILNCKININYMSKL